MSRDGDGRRDRGDRVEPGEHGERDRRGDPLYRALAGFLCVSFALVGLLFLVLPRAVLSIFDAWSLAVGLARSDAGPGELFVVLAGAYMYLVTALAWSMFRHPRELAPACLLVQAKLASALLSFAVFFLRHPHLVLLVNGIVDGCIGGLVLLLLMRRSRVASRAPGSHA